MKLKTLFAALVMGIGACSVGISAELLDRMLGYGELGCASSCCAKPTFGCDQAPVHSCAPAAACNCRSVPARRCSPDPLFGVRPHAAHGCAHVGHGLLDNILGNGLHWHAQPGQPHGTCNCHSHGGSFTHGVPVPAAIYQGESIPADSTPTEALPPGNSGSGEASPFEDESDPTIPGIQGARLPRSAKRTRMNVAFTDHAGPVVDPTAFLPSQRYHVRPTSANVSGKNQ